MEEKGELKQDLLAKKYGTNGDETTQYSIPVWGRSWSKQLCLCNEMNFLVHYLFLFYFGLLFVNSFLYDAVAFTLTYNLACFCLQVGFIVAMTFGRITLTRCIGGTVSEVLLWPFGTFTTSDYVVTKKSQLCVYFGELLFIIPLSCVWWIIWTEVDQCDYQFIIVNPNWEDCFGYNLASFAFHLLLFLVVFNTIVPVHPLHGSFAFVSVFQDSLSIDNIARLCLFISAGWLGFFMICAVVFKNFMCTLISLFILWQTWTLIQHYRYKSLRYHPLFEHIKVKRNKGKNIGNKIKNTIDNMKKGKYEPLDVTPDDMREVLENPELITEHRKNIGQVIEAGTAYEFDSEKSKKTFEQWLGQGPQEIYAEAMEEEASNKDAILNAQLKNAVLTIEHTQDGSDEQYVSFDNAFDGV